MKKGSKELGKKYARKVANTSKKVCKEGSKALSNRIHKKVARI